MPAKKSGFVDPSAGVVVEEEGAASKGGPFMALDQNRFMNVNYSAEFLATLPEKIRKRVNGLLALDAKYGEARAAYDQARRDLLAKFEKEVAAPLYAQRKKLVTGETAPTEELIKEGFPEEHKVVDIGTAEGAAAAATGGSDTLDDFWLRALKRHVIVADMITDRDETVMKHVIDVSVGNLEAPQRGFVVTFEFAANEFFSNKTLTKTFHVKEVFGELTVERTEGTTIQWSGEEKNVTMKVVTKKQKAKVKGKIVHRTVKKQLRCDSFFHFFSSTTQPAGKKDGADDEEGADGDIPEDASDFAEMDDEQWLGLANVLKDKIIPYAANYYTGEAPDGESDLDDDDYDFSDDEDGEEEEDDDEKDDTRPVRGGGAGGMKVREASSGSGGAGTRGGRVGATAPGGKQDCKQQ